MRPYNWQTSIAVQHELRPGIGVTVGYFRTWWGNGGPGSGDFHVTDNLAVTPADLRSVLHHRAARRRLPGGGGYQVCGLYDVKPGQFGQVDNLISDVNDVGEPHAGLQRRRAQHECPVRARRGRAGRNRDGTDHGRYLHDA